ncbi:hypothetical protein ETB97_009054 [Aspergillus alliaceus]|uniref:Uncharacterized protein n=1 Tax=Petromyces alliaceus TaxID=209559 RepID=A0A8H6A8X8_PETAA|nr:hypothetical protein ETB97_009054 [Aspergillus burnettii]
MRPLNGTASSTKPTLAPHFRFLASGLQSNEKNTPLPFVTPVPISWLQNPIRLIIRGVNETHYTLSAASSVRPNEIQLIGQVPATIVSDGAGLFTGSLVGVYATNNGGSGATPSYISRWRYRGIGQAIVKGQYEMAL